MPKKRRGSPNLYSKTAVKLGKSLTPKGIHFLSTLAQKAGLSHSELLEGMAKGQIAVSSDSAQIQFVIKTIADHAAQDSEINVVKTKLQSNQQSVSSAKDDDESKAKQLAEQSHTIAEKQQQLDHLQEQLKSRLTEQTQLQSSYDTLQQQSQQQNQVIADKQQQITYLQVQLESQRNWQANQQSTYESMKQKFQEQTQELDTLRQQLAQLRSLGAIGEAHLNKWQSRNASR